RKWGASRCRLRKQRLALCFVRGRPYSGRLTPATGRTCVAPATHGKGGFEAAPDSGASGDGAVAGAVPAPIGRTDFLAALKNRPRGIDIVLLQAGDILGLGEVDRFDAAHRLAHTALFRRPVFQRHWRTWRPELEDGLQLLADSLAIVGRIGAQMGVGPLCRRPRCGAVYNVDSAGRPHSQPVAQPATPPG